MKFSELFNSTSSPRSPISSNNIRRNENEDEEKEYALMYSGCSFCFYGLLLGFLLAGILLATILALWLSPNTETTDSSTSNSGSSISLGSSITTTTTVMKTCTDWIWNSTGETIAGVTGSAGTAANQLSSPWNIFIDVKNNNTLYIADSGNHRIQKWLLGAPTGTTVAGVSGSVGATATLLNTPKDVFVDSSQNLYVADSLNNRIQFFSYGILSGSTVSSGWSSPGSLWGVQVVNNLIYACDNTKSAIWKNGSVVAGNQIAGSGNNQLNLPQGFAVDTSMVPGTIYAVNSQQHTIVQWTANTTTGNIVAGSNGIQGSSSTLLMYPVSIKLDAYTNMFVVDNNNHRIQLFCRYPTVNMTARTIAGTGAKGSTANTLTFPAGIALDSSMNLYVSDTSNHRIQRFQRLV
ncbi:hypothetical protein I4U23_011764 [Adineta vaga]|nr:hypothetical protein I4U23_011764 [Adineta vaga]